MISTDVPGGDIGCGEREIGFLFGQYKKLKNHWDGALTGKGVALGGSHGRIEATGYGVVLFADEMLKVRNQSFNGKRVCVSGAGNVAQHCVEKLIEYGAIVVTMSDSDGYIYEPQGITSKQLEYIKILKNVKRGRIKEYLNFSNTAIYTPHKRPWGEKCDIAIPCATENEITLEDVKTLHSNGCWAVIEAANMPCTNEAIDYCFKNGILFGPAKAVNAGGVATSGLEMIQNTIGMQWTKEQVTSKLKNIMVEIHNTTYNAAKNLGHEGNYQLGANAAAFMKVADAMIAEGVI